MGGEKMGMLGQLFDDKHGDESEAECEAAVAKLCGACEKQENGRECWAKCKEEHEAEISAACERPGKAGKAGMLAMMGKDTKGKRGEKEGMLAMMGKDTKGKR